MSGTNSLSPEEKEFFSLVYQATLANPFSDARAAVDHRIAGIYPGIERSGVIEQAIAEIKARIRDLEQKGRADLSAYTGEDGRILRVAFLFDIFHDWAEGFDQLILDQLDHGERTLTASFAESALLQLRRRGYDRQEALRLFALFYQIRRAYYFINRELVGQSPCMKKLREDLWNNVFTCDLELYNEYLWSRMEDFSTLLLGATGAGKGTAALCIGRSGYIPFDEKKGAFSESFTRSFISLNLSQFPENLIESELFGHKKGAFTGAVEDHQGVFDRCSPYGAIFLDEIGEVSIPVQIKLLKVLEERSFCPVGSHRERRFQGRIIAATNDSLESMIGAGRLRDDFYYRLCSDVIMVPPLRQRLQETPDELDDLLAFTIRKIIGRPTPALARMVKQAIAEHLGPQYAWPGNVRELGQCVRRMLLKRHYAGLPTAVKEASELAGLSEKIDTGAIDAKTLVQAYCQRLYEKYGLYSEVAKITGLDRRTVKKHIEATHLEKV